MYIDIWLLIRRLDRWILSICGMCQLEAAFHFDLGIGRRSWWLDGMMFGLVDQQQAVIDARELARIALVYNCGQLQLRVCLLQVYLEETKRMCCELGRSMVQ